MKKSIALFVLTLVFTTSCAKRNNLEPVIKFKTSSGDIVVKLYAETPKHRDNFVKLVESGFYDGVLFHRVIADFMIQAGDPESKNAKKDQMLGSGDVGYRIPAEFIYPKYYHKKGVLAAAREGDQVNPLQESSGCQFYIVQGKTFTDDQLNAMDKSKERKVESKLFQEMMNAQKETANKYKLEGNKLKFDELRDSIMTAVHEKMKQNQSWKFTEQQRKDYKTIGGTPHLDGAYTVFGEVIEGMDIVTLISKAKTSESDRPVDDIRVIKAKRIK